MAVDLLDATVRMLVEPLRAMFATDARAATALIGLLVVGVGLVVTERTEVSA